MLDIINESLYTDNVTETKRCPMAYMCQTKKKAIAPQIKAVLAKYGIKATIGVNNYSTLVVNIKSGALDFIGAANKNNQQYAERTGQQAYEVKDHYGVNPYWEVEHMENIGEKKIANFFKELIAAMNGKGSGFANYDESDIMTDYFSVGWYIDINVGKWDKPYILTK